MFPAAFNRQCWTVIRCAILMLLSAPSLFADDIVPSLFVEDCRSCHTGLKPQGEFSLEDLKSDFTDDANRQRWVKVLEQLRSGTMPPKEKPRPAAQEITAVVDDIHKKIAAAESEAIALRGRTALRRLNRAEYVNTIRNLLAVDVQLKDLLPPDTSITGFDNSDESTHVSSYLMQSYLDAVERVLQAANASGPKPKAIKRRFDIKDEKTVKPTGSVYRPTLTMASRSSAHGSRPTSRSRCGNSKVASGDGIAFEFPDAATRRRNPSHSM